MYSTKKYIGTTMAALVVLSAIMAAGMLTVEAEDVNNPTIWGYAGVSGTPQVTPLDGIEGITVLLYRAFDVFDTTPYMSFTTTDETGYFSFEVPPGYYYLDVEPMTEGDNFYHLNAVDMISVGLVDYGNYTRTDVPLAEKTIDAHFYGVVTDGTTPVSGASVKVWNADTGFTSTASTNSQGIYMVDVYTGTFDALVTVGSVQRMYTTMTVTESTDGTEHIILQEMPYNDAINLRVNGVAHPADDYDLTYPNLEVRELNNRDHVTLSYNWLNNVNETKGNFNSVGVVVYLENRKESMVYIGFENATGNYTIDEADYEYNTTSREITISTLVNGTLYIHYNFIEVLHEDDLYVGRNVEDINIKSPRITGTVIDEDTQAPVPATTSTRVVLYNKTSKMVHSRTVSPTFNIRAPHGSYILVIQPDGYAPYTHTNLVISGDVYLNNFLGAEAMTFSRMPSHASRITHFAFPEGKWENLTVTWNITLDSWGYLPGLGEDVKNLRLQIDREHGDGNGELLESEVEAFETALRNKKPEFISTDGLFTFNNTLYKFVDDSYDVRVIMPSMDMTNTTPVIIEMTANYSSMEDIEEGEEHYPAKLTMTRNTGEYRISLLPYYARSDAPATNDPQAPGVVDVVVDSSMNWGEISMTVKRISEPIPSISLTTSPKVVRSETEYVVKNGTDITFNGAGSTVADGEISHYKWNFGDGTVTDWLAESTIVHNYTASHHLGRTVTLTVKDTAGQENHTTIHVIPDGTAPVVNITANRTNAGQDHQIMFNGSATVDLVSDQANLSFRWNFGDGVISTEKTTTHTYSMPGTYVVYLNVTDEMGNVGTEGITITITDSMPPRAQVVVDRNVVEGSSVLFNASTSYDNEGNITGYKWDFGDGNTPTTWLTETTIEHTFIEAGTYNVNLTVKDEAGLENTTTVVMNVRVGPRADIEILEIRVEGNPVNGKKTTVIVVITNRGEKNCTESIAVELKDGERVVGTVQVPALNVGQNGTATFTWTPTAKGNMLLTANATYENEWTTTLFNNMLTKDVSVNPSTMETYGATIIVLVVIVVLLVLLFGRDKIREMMSTGSSPEKKDRKDKN